MAKRLFSVLPSVLCGQGICLRQEKPEGKVFGTVTEPEHRQQLRNSVADFAGRAVDAQALRAALASDAGFSRERWKEMAGLGWTCLALPETFDGLQMDPADLAALHHEIGRAALPEPLAIVPLLVGQILAHGENTALAQATLPGLVAGETLATLGWQNRLGALGSTDVGPTARWTETGWQLSGTLRFVPLAGLAKTMTVAARTDDGIALFWLDEMPGASETIRQADGTVQGTIELDVSLREEDLIAGPTSGAALLDRALDMARLAACAELLGVMERALEMTLDHLRQREQFGKPIGSFQALQHRAVDLYIQIELSRSTVLRAADAFDTDARAAQVSAAKTRCGDAAHKILKECIQMHGAIGYTAEYDLSLYVNRGLQLASWLGNPRAHRARWAARMFDRGDAR